MGLFSVAVQGPVQNFCSGKDSHEPVRALPPPWGQSHGLGTLGALDPQTEDRLMMSLLGQAPRVVMEGGEEAAMSSKHS